MPAPAARREAAPPESDSQSRVVPLIVAALLALLLVGGGGVWLLHRSQGAPGSSVAAVPAPQSGDPGSVGAPPSPGLRVPANGPSVLVGPAGRGGPGLPTAVPGPRGPSVAGVPGGRTPGGPGIVNAPAGSAGPSVTGASGGPRGGPAVTGTPSGPPGPSVVKASDRPHQGPAVTTAPGSLAPTGPSVAKSPAKSTAGPPVAAQPPSPKEPAQPPGMPEDISRYLRFLAGVEAQRKQYEALLTNRMLATIPNLLMPNFDDENVQPPGQQLVRQYAQMAQQYAQATVRFQAMARQVRVPASCRRLHANYSIALSLNPRLIMETAGRLDAGDYGGLLMMRGSVGKTIELNYQAADDELANLCGQYGMRKPFDIGNGSGGSDILLP